MTPTKAQIQLEDRIDQESERRGLTFKATCQTCGKVVSTLQEGREHQARGCDILPH